MAGTEKQPLVAPLQTIGKNGFLYVYVSNESPQDVYFDDLTVKHFTGPLQQEQSFYPFGLQMAAISSKALLKTNVPFKYNAGNELEEEGSLNYYNTFYRKYDAQLGRFTGIDIRAEESYGMSVYNYGANNPVLYNDPMGDMFGLEKGPDGNYHTDWVTRMMWNDWGFYQEIGQVPMMNYGNGGPYGVYYNAHGVSSTTILSMLSFGQQLQQRLNGDLGFFSSSSRGMYFLNNRNNQDNYNGNRVDRMDEGVLNASKFININDLKSGGIDLTSDLNKRIETMDATFGTLGSVIDLVYGGPIVTYPLKLAVFGYVQYKGAKTEFMNPKAFRNSVFTINKGGYVNGEHFSPDDFGNYSYGAAANSMGLLSSHAIQGAGLYAIISGSVIDITNFEGCFDEKKDTKMILRGYYDRK
jgi:RHS repeat-associated protein